MDPASPASSCTIGEEVQEMEHNGGGNGRTTVNMDIASPASTCTISEEVREIKTEPKYRGNDEGTIDHVFDVLNAHSHPFILVGLVAHRWMGCASSVDASFDLVLRASQLPIIVASLAKTGFWTTVDSTKALEVFKSDAAWQGFESIAERERLERLCEADALLKWQGMQGIGFSYMRIWSDVAYNIDIDASPLVQVPELYPWNPFLVEEEFHPALRRDDGWFYGPHTLDDATTDDGVYDGADAGYPIFSPVFRRAKGARNTTPINILSIPAYLDVLVYHTKHCATSKPGLASSADWQIENITKTLFLELPHQREPLLFQVEAETENFLLSYLAKYERKPHYVSTRLAEDVLVNAWDPDSYPDGSYPENAWKVRKSSDQPQASGSSSTGAVLTEALGASSRNTKRPCPIPSI